MADLAMPDALSSAEPITEHRLPGCTGSWHDDDMCDVVLADLPGPGVSLIAEAERGADKPAELIVWESEGPRNLLRTTDSAQARAFADQLRKLAAAVDKGAVLLEGDALSPSKPEPVDYAARFAALDSDVLFDVEEQGDCEAARNYVESLLIVLTEWRTRVVGLLAETPAEWAVPEVGEYQRALNRTREAWLQFNFRYQGGPDLPWPFDLPQTVARSPIDLANAPVARIVSAGRRDLVVREAVAA
jgi:hypothetical protein